MSNLLLAGQSLAGKTFDKNLFAKLSRKGRDINLLIYT
jgi:hypothetical protein